MSFEVQNTSCVWVFIFFSELMKCLFTISLNRLFMPLMSISALSVLVTLRFGLLIVQLNPRDLGSCAHAFFLLIDVWSSILPVLSSTQHSFFCSVDCICFVLFGFDSKFQLVHPFALLSVLLGFLSILLTFPSSLLASLIIPSAEFISLSVSSFMPFNILPENLNSSCSFSFTASLNSVIGELSSGHPAVLLFHISCVSVLWFSHLLVVVYLVLFSDLHWAAQSARHTAPGVTQWGNTSCYWHTDSGFFFSVELRQ